MEEKKNDGIKVTIRLSEEEFSQIQKKSEELGITVSAFIRQGIHLNLNNDGFDIDEELKHAEKVKKVVQDRLQKLTKLNKIISETEKCNEQIKTTQKQLGREHL